MREGELRPSGQDVKQSQAAQESHPAMSRNKQMDLFNTVVVMCSKFGKPYTRRDMLDGLNGLIQPKDIFALGTMQFNHSWFLRTTSSAAKDKLLSAGFITVKGHRATIHSCSAQDVTIRLHWLMYGVTEASIQSALSSYGEIKTVTWEKTTEKGLEHSYTGVVRVCMKLKDNVTVDKIPHVTLIAGSPSLLIIKDRPPMCLRCKNVGHIRRHCDVPWCRRCNSYGHPAEECRGKSFSSVVGNNSQQVANTEEAEDFQMETEETSANNDAANMTQENEDETRADVTVETQDESEKSIPVQNEIKDGSQDVSANQATKTTSEDNSTVAQTTMKRRNSEDETSGFTQVTGKKKANHKQKSILNIDIQTSNQFDVLETEHYTSNMENKSVENNFKDGEELPTDPT